MKTVLLLIGFVLAIGHSAEAQQSDKAWRIGYLDPSTHSLTMGFLEAFREEMKKLGWIEGKNIIIENRFAESAATPLVREWSMRIRAAGMKSIISFFEAQGFTVASVPWETRTTSEATRRQSGRHWSSVGRLGFESSTGCQNLCSFSAALE